MTVIGRRVEEICTTRGNLKDSKLISRQTKVMKDPILVNALPQVMNAPIFTIKKKDNRSRCLAVESRGCGNGAYQSIPKEGLVPIIARSTKQKGAPGTRVAIGEKGCVGPSCRPRGVAVVDAKGFAGPIARCVAIDTKPNCTLNQLCSVQFE